MSSASGSAAPEQVKLSKAQLSLIRASPIHRRIRLAVYSILSLSIVGFLTSIVVVLLGCILAGHLLRQHRWLVVHYVFASLFATLWLAYTGVYYRDVKYGAWSDQLKIDSGWISFAVVFSSSFFFYLFYKLQTLATVESLGAHCIFACDTDLSFIRLSPLIVGIINLVLLAVQLYLLVLLFRNPIVNPPLDENGMPKAINPLDGTVLPIGPNGKPILPPELRPTSGGAGQVTTDARRPPESEADGSDWASASASDSELEGKKLLEKELGSGSHHKESKSERSNRRGYDVV
ncbi:hypothetical protein JCM11491_004810 [Sporobolomyces phaffii]